MNDKIKEILEMITNKGFKAYVVGGYVRDYLRKILKVISTPSFAPFKKESNIGILSFNPYIITNKIIIGIANIEI